MRANIVLFYRGIMNQPNSKQLNDIHRLTHNGQYRYKITRFHYGDITVRIYKGNITQRYIIDISGHVFQETVYRGHSGLK
jgi:hypothetical protein